MIVELGSRAGVLGCCGPVLGCWGSGIRGMGGACGCHGVLQQTLLRPNFCFCGVWSTYTAVSWRRHGGVCRQRLARPYASVAVVASLAAASLVVSKRLNTVDADMSSERLYHLHIGQCPFTAGLQRAGDGKGSMLSEARGKF